MPRPSFNFQIVGGTKPAQTQTTIALLASGIMSIHGNTYEAFNMKQFTHALRMYDKAKKTVAVKLLKKEQPGAVLIQKFKDQNAKISFGSFIKTTRIKSAISKNYEVKRYSNDTFYFNVEEPIGSSSRKRSKRGRPAGSKNKPKK